MKNQPEFLRHRPAVLAALEVFLSRQAQLPGSGLPWRQDAAERLLKFVAAGKLLRGCLVAYAYELCGGDIPLSPAVLSTAAALELAHAALLIHDDIIDRADLRRNQPALHRQYEPLMERSGAAAHLGQSLALCAGDMALFMAFELLGTVPVSAGKASLVSLLAGELTTVCAGQMEDIRLTGTSRPAAKRTIYAVMRAKTAAYTVALPLSAGAVLAGQPASLRRQLYTVGLAAGTLFQLRDDELDVFGETGKLGKPIGADIREGKQTLLYYYLWHSADNVERRRLRTVFGNPDTGSAEIVAVRRMLRRHQVRTHLAADMNRLGRDAGRQINKLDLSPPAKRELRQLVAFCARRET